MRAADGSGRPNWLVRVNARPDTIYISRSRAVLATRRDGTIDGEAGHGLFVDETRLLSRYRYRIEGESPVPNVLSTIDQHSWMGYYVIVAPGVDAGPEDRGSGHVPAASQHPLEMRVSRFIRDSLHEEIELTNFAHATTRFTFAIDLDADFADLGETGGEREQVGELTREWTDDGLAFRYRATHEFHQQNENGVAELERSMTVVVRGHSARYENGAITFEVELAPHASWNVALDFVTDAVSIGSDDSFLARATSFAVPGSDTLAPVIAGTLDQAKFDLASLRLYDLDTRDGWTMAAGLPLYVALYGRDALTAGWQAGLLGSEMMRGVLQVLADRRGREDNAWRDEQPGRMLHEAHTGPLSTLNFNPRARSYSSMTTSGLYAFIAAELWHWTGDREAIERYIDPALEALEWLDRDGDLDGDGFYEYKTRSIDGVRNQGWKDSPDAIVDHEGNLVEPPIATCEEQAFAHIAKLHLSETLFWLGRRDEAKRLFHEANELKKRFHEAFWMPAERFYALGLDAQKRQIRSIASNAGHCIATAIADTDVAQAVVDRMFAPDLFSGWGIRTLSSAHPSFNPYSYHLGSIWPVEHGTFALGFMRYGLHDRVAQIARAQFEAAALFDFYRLPELFSGHARDEEHPFPAVYPNANPTQAWSASSVFCLLQALLGLYPYAPLHLLIVDPHLPEWLPDITLRDLRVGEATVTIRFRRKKDGRSTYTVVRKRGKLHVVRQPMPWSLTTSWAERLKELLTSLLPGK